MNSCGKGHIQSFVSWLVVYNVKKGFSNKIYLVLTYNWFLVTELPLKGHFEGEIVVFINNIYEFFLKVMKFVVNLKKNVLVFWGF